jgi:UDPglucose 6-dehydrogenase
VKSVVWNLEGKRVALWGLAFKPDTDDLRSAPALEVARRLVSSRAHLSVYDPVTMPQAKRLLPEADFAGDAYAAASGADCLVICTEWPEFAGVDLDRLLAVMADPIVVDGRNLYQPERMERAGFIYASIGRPTVGGTRPS